MNSHKTAIKRNKLSAPMRFIMYSKLLESKKILEFGCGRGDDARRLIDCGYDVAMYDPHFYPHKPTGKYDVVTCHYVLNTVSNEDAEKILRDIKSYLKDGGVAFITVRRDIKKDVVTSINTIQRNVILDLESLKRNSSYEIYMMRK